MSRREYRPAVSTCFGARHRDPFRGLRRLRGCFRCRPCNAQAQMATHALLANHHQQIMTIGGPEPLLRQCVEPAEPSLEFWPCRPTFKTPTAASPRANGPRTALATSLAARHQPTSIVSRPHPDATQTRIASGTPGAGFDPSANFVGAFGEENWASGSWVLWDCASRVHATRQRKVISQLGRPAMVSSWRSTRVVTASRLARREPVTAGPPGRRWRTNPTSQVGGSQRATAGLARPCPELGLEPFV